MGGDNYYVPSAGLTSGKSVPLLLICPLSAASAGIFFHEMDVDITSLDYEHL